MTAGPCTACASAGNARGAGADAGETRSACAEGTAGPQPLRIYARFAPDRAGEAYDALEAVIAAL